jgi:probable HAF family extracellular repeat protein
MEGAVDQDVRQPEIFRCRKHQGTSVLAATLVGLLLGVQVGCGGGSSGTPGGGGPPPQTFTTIDVADAGTSSEQGTFALVGNLSGEVAGYYIDPSGFFHGFIRNAAGAITTVDVPGNGNHGANISGIDEAGDTVGAYFDSLDVEHSFVRSSQGTITTFDPPNSSSGAQSINDSATVAGGFVDVNGAHGYLRAPDGTFTTFDPTGSGTLIQIVVPFQINASGAVTGSYIDIYGVRHGFLRDPSGNITILDAPGAGTAAYQGTDLLGMNANGTIVGGIDVGTVNGVVGTSHSLVLTTDGPYTIFDPPQSGAHSSLAEAINNSGTVVGIYRDANLVRHAYLRQPDGTFISFDDPEAAQLPLSDTDLGTIPRSINANGAVVGFYADANGVRHGFIWQ